MSASEKHLRVGLVWREIFVAALKMIFVQKAIRILIPQSICEAALTLQIPASITFARKVFLFCYKRYFSASQRRCQDLLSLSFSDFHLNCDSGVCQESDCRRRKTENHRGQEGGGE